MVKDKDLDFDPIELSPEAQREIEAMAKLHQESIPRSLSSLGLPFEVIFGKRKEPPRGA